MVAKGNYAIRLETGVVLRYLMLKGAASLPGG